MLHNKLKTLRASRTPKSYSSIISYFIKRCISYSTFLKSHQQKFESEVTNNVIDITNNNIKMHSAKKIPTIFYEYVQKINPKFKGKIFQNYLTLSLNDSDPYLISSKVGDNFVALIKDDLLENMCHVLELNPGFGVLTESLLKAGIPFLYLYEKHSEFYIELLELSKKYPGKFNLQKANLFKLPKMLNLNGKSTIDESPYKLLNNIQTKEWHDKSCMQVIGATTKAVFIRHLVLSTIFQTGFMIYGRPIFYLAIPPSVWIKFVSPVRKTTANYIIFNNVFDYKIFGKLDRRGFIPWKKRRKSKKTDIMLQDDEIFYVIKLEPKPNLVSSFGGKKNIIHFWHFVRHHFYRPSMRVIPSLEKIIPGCGVRLIEKNYNIYTEFGQLSPSQVYELYMEFQSWPEFQHSCFLLSAKAVKETFCSYMEEEYDEH